MVGDIDDAWHAALDLVVRYREVIARIANEVMRRGRLDEAGVVAILAEFFVTSVSCFTLV